MASTSPPQTRVAQLDAREVLTDERFLGDLRALADRQQRDYAAVEAEARECLQELSVRPADRYLGWVAVLARFMLTRSFEPEFDINRERLDWLKEQASKRPLVFLWSHKSHLDSFVFMKALYDAEFVPQPLSFAGINMAFSGFAALARNSGAIFLRRSFRDDEVYKLVLRHFIDHLVERRIPLSWSIEGTRSRTGKLMPPKLGLIQWVVDSYRRASCEDALLVPVAISFDQIPEIDDYVAMQRGQPKRKESLKWFLDYIVGMKAQYGKIYVRFAEPVALSDSVCVSEAMLTRDAGRVQVQKLAFEVSSRIENAKPINPTDLVTLVLLAVQERGLDRQRIAAQAAEIVDLIEARDLPTAGDLRTAMGAGLPERLAALTDTGLLEAVGSGPEAVYRIRPGQQLAAAYYRNTIVHYFLSSAIAEVALARVDRARVQRARLTRSTTAATSAPAGAPGGATESGGHDGTTGPGRDPVLRQALAIRDLLKFEFFFKVKEQFLEDAAGYLDYRYPSWEERGFAERAPLFGPGILRSFIEAYRILALAIVSRGDQAIEEDRDVLIRGCLQRGEAMLRGGEISTEAALAQPMFETAIRLADYRGLLAGDPLELEVARPAFVTETEDLLAAIDDLQKRADARLGLGSRAAVKIGLR